MKYVKGATMARLVLVVSLGYLCVAHLMRQIYDYGNFVLDITGYCTTHLFTILVVQIYAHVLIMLYEEMDISVVRTTNILSLRAIEVSLSAASG